MPLSPEDAQTLSWLCDMTYVNPFGESREKAESLLAGEAYHARYGASGWDQPQPSKKVKRQKKQSDQIATSGPDTDLNPNMPFVLGASEKLAEKFNTEGADFDRKQAVQWYHTSLFILYHRIRLPFDEVITAGLRQHAERAKDLKDTGDDAYKPGLKMTPFRQFVADAKWLLAPLKKCKHPTPLNELKDAKDQINWLSHLFACFFQLRRAFYNIDCYIIGSSKPVQKLRQQIWESIFTHDMQLYERALYQSMGDYTLLITGPSGTGKELVARAVGLSRYIPFDSETLTFADCFTGSFLPLNLSAMSQSLIESELFGHKKGAYTGAQIDRKGWLEICSDVGTVFLDELGELDPAIQVKLLRVLQSRQFNRLGETKTRIFRGKVIAATNRNLSDQIDKGAFREDLFYRLCSDHIQMPSLKSRFDDDPAERLSLIQFLLGKQLHGCDEAMLNEKSQEMDRWIEMNLGHGYEWPGNVRELEQCLRSLIIRHHYTPIAEQFPASGESSATKAKYAGIPDCLAPLIEQMIQGDLQTEELVNIYCTIAYAKANSYEGAARLIGMDRRTIKSRMEPELLKELSK